MDADNASGTSVCKTCGGPADACPVCRAIPNSVSDKTHGSGFQNVPPDATRNSAAIIGAIRMGLPLTADSTAVAERVLRKLEAAGFKVVPE